MQTSRAIGLMSGTSMDGVDLAWVDTDGKRSITRGPTAFRAYSDDERAMLRAALAQAVQIADRRQRPPLIAACEAMVTRCHAEAVETFMAERNLHPHDIDIVGFHGQTILHRPAERLTLQIGDGAGLASRLGIPVAYDFRAADVAAGGQGAPLVPVYHQALALAAGIEAPVALLNIGGVANVTFIRPGHDPVAFDTGPGNALLDDLMLARAGLPMDRDGATAGLGTVDRMILDQLLAHAYFGAPPPKSLDRNAFSGSTLQHLSLEDAAATLTAFTAESIARSMALLPVLPVELIVCGGGACNPLLLRELAARIPATVTTAAERGWSVDSMEAEAFAYLAVRCAKGLPITFPSTTGVPVALSGGTIARPAATA